MDDHAAEEWRRQYGTVYRFVRRRSGSHEDAEDVTQEVFSAAITALGQARLEAETPPLAWLYTVARRRLIDRLRTGAPVTVPFDEETVGGVEGQAYGPGVVQELVDGLKTLEEAQRRVVIAKLFEGRSFAEIAAELSVTEEACRKRFSRGLAALRHHLEKEGVAS